MSHALKKVAPAALPDMSHLKTADFENVYEPSDDTFLLVDALAADEQELRSRHPTVCVEIGSGSGCVITKLGQLLPQAALLAGDVNRAACVASVSTGFANHCSLDAVQMDLVTCIRPGTVDVLVFNPPYVPTSADELADALASADISAAWAGGERGRQVTDRLLNTVGAALSPRGLFYLLGVQENDPHEMAAVLLEKHGLRSTIVAERRAQNERLFVMRCHRGDAAS